MPKTHRPVGHDERLHLVDHLDELRARLIVCLLALGGAFAICFWQAHRLLKLLERPIDAELARQARKGVGLSGQADSTQRALLKLAAADQGIARAIARPANGLSASLRHAAAVAVPQIHAAVNGVLHTASPDNLLTLGIGEPFTQTVTVSLYFAVVLALPVILFELYAFVIPAVSPRERALALPVMLAVPALFIGGVAFGYFIVLPAAVHFLVGFNSGSFDVNVQASSYFPFAGLILVAMAVIFQLPVAVVAAVRAGIVTTRQLRHNRRIAFAIAVVIAALLPGDAITMIFETVPIVVLYEVGILVAAILDRRDSRRASRATGVAAAAVAGRSSTPPPPSADHGR
jgi:sec-independent protein translocase protein TatC